MTSWLTVLIAAVVAIVAIMQWHVARQRFVLDLFDRRFKAYNDVLNALRPIISAGDATHNNIVDLHVAAHNSKFLFGSDVNDYLKSLISTAAELHYWNTIYNTKDAQAEHAPTGMHKCLLAINDALAKYPELCQHYMMMPEKRVRSPLEWFHDRNELRKSYGSEPPESIEL